MSRFKTSVNEYVLALKTEIEQIESISRARRHKGQLTGDSLELVKIDLRQEGKCEAFINVVSNQASRDRVNNGVFLDVLIQVHIIGMTDAKPDDIGYSDDVYDCAEDVYEMIVMSRNIMNGLVLPGEPVLGALTNTYDSIVENTRETFSTITFTQKIKT